MAYNLSIKVSVPIDNSKRQAKQNAGVSYYSRDKEERERQKSHQQPFYELWIIKSFNPLTGTYNLKDLSDRKRLKGVVNCYESPGQIDVGDTVVVGYYYNDRRRPYILKPGNQVLAEGQTVIIPSYGLWLRKAARTKGRYWAERSEIYPTRVQGNTKQVLDDQVHGNTVRVYNNIWMRTDDPDQEGENINLIDIDMLNNGVTIVEQPAEILAAAWDSNQRYLMIPSFSTLPGGYAEGYAEGFDLGYAGDGGYSPYSYGFDDYTNGDGYNPLLYYPYPSPPSGHSSDYNNGWTDGYLAGWTQAYDQGYQDAGGTIG